MSLQKVSCSCRNGVPVLQIYCLLESVMSGSSFQNYLICICPLYNKHWNVCLFSVLLEWSTDATLTFSKEWNFVVTVNVGVIIGDSLSIKINRYLFFGCFVAFQYVHHLFSTKMNYNPSYWSNCYTVYLSNSKTVSDPLSLTIGWRTVITIGNPNNLMC